MSLLGHKLKALRQQIGLSQEAIGAQGFVSTPGWIKIENGQRQASEKLLARFVDWLVSDKHITKSARQPLLEELLLRKHLGNRSVWLRDTLKAVAAATIWGQAIVEEMKRPAPAKSRRAGPWPSPPREVAAR